MAEWDYDVAILGAGTAGLAAYKAARKTTQRIVMLDGGELGTTCAKTGCMPSKLLIAAANAAHDARHTALFGVATGKVTIDGAAVMRRLRAERDRFVGFVKDALVEFDVNLVRHNAQFLNDHQLALANGDRLSARSIIIATGSRPAIPAPFEQAGDRIVTTEQIFEWPDLPNRVAVFGAGIIGLELGQALHRLGVTVQLYGRGHTVGPLTDAAIRDYAARQFETEFPACWHADASISRDGDEVVVSNAGGKPARFDYLLAATGRRANVDQLALENTTLKLDQRGIPVFDRQSGQAGDSHIFIAGDADAVLPLLHEAAEEGRITGENAARVEGIRRLTPKTPLSIIFTEPQIAMVGKNRAELQATGVAFETGAVSFEEQGRARVMGVNRGLLHVYGSRETGQLLGAEMIGPAAEHLAHLLAWSIEGKLTVTEILERPIYHPTIEEGLRTALRKLSAALGRTPEPPRGCIDCGPGG